MAQVPVRETVIGDHMPVRDISGDARLSAGPIGFVQQAGCNEERGLRDAAFAQGSAQLLRTFVGREESTRLARYIVET